MRVRLTWGATKASAWLNAAMYRYDLLDRIGRCTERQGGQLLAFGFEGPRVRLVLDLPGRASLSNVLRGVRVGTSRVARGWGMPLGETTSRSSAIEAGGLEHAVIWAHRGPLDAGAASPLASPWSSHRDLLGFRRMKRFDGSPLASLVDARRVHARLGGLPLPADWPPALDGRPDLFTVLRVAAAMHGVLPDDRRCFRLFVHLARQAGWGTRPMAETLDLSTRRIRQLLAVPEPLEPVGLACLADERLCCVP